MGMPHIMGHSVINMKMQKTKADHITGKSVKFMLMIICTVAIKFIFMVMCIHKFPLALHIEIYILSFIIGMND